jgi:hypothetical protein
LSEGKISQFVELNWYFFIYSAKNSFKKPHKDYYLTAKEKKNSFSLNRQPIPRSSYSAQYLNYGHIPTYSYKPDTIRQSPETSLAIKASTYQQ